VATGAEHMVASEATITDSAVRETRSAQLAGNLTSDALLASSLRDRLSRVAGPVSTLDLGGIHELVCRYVAELRDRGWPPERVITAVKQVARDAGLRASANQALAESRWTDTDRLLAKLVRWCIVRYYEPAGDLPSAREPQSWFKSRRPNSG
jgi:hypothetical protein